MNWVRSTSCFANAPFTANTPVTLTNVSSQTAEELPSGAMIMEIYAHAGTTVASSSPATLQVGYSGNNGAFLPSGAGCNNVTLNSGAMRFVAPTSQQALTSSKILTMTSDENCSSGQVQIVVTYVLWDELPY